MITTREEVMGLIEQSIKVGEQRMALRIMKAIRGRTHSQAVFRVIGIVSELAPMSADRLLDTTEVTGDVL